MGDVRLMLRSLLQPLRCLSASEPPGRTQRREREERRPHPKQGRGMKRSKGAFPGWTQLTYLLLLCGAHRCERGRRGRDARQRGEKRREKGP